MAFGTPTLSSDDYSHILASILLGELSETFFMGILICQVARYFSTFHHDAQWIRRLIGVVMVLSIVKWLQGLAMAYLTFIIHFGDMEYYTTVPWPHAVAVPLIAVLGASSQSFFAWRCFILMGRNWYLLTFIGFGMLSIIAVAFAIMVALIAFPSHKQLATYLSMVAFFITIMIDVTISGHVCFKLARAKVDSRVPRTRRLITKLIAITFGAACPPTLTLIVAAALTLKPGNVYELFDMLSPRLYAFSFLWTLNSRGILTEGSDGTLFDDLTGLTLPHHDTSRPVSPDIAFATNIELKPSQNGSTLDGRMSLRYVRTISLEEVPPKGTFDGEGEQWPSSEEPVMA